MKKKKQKFYMIKMNRFLGVLLFIGFLIINESCERRPSELIFAVEKGVWESLLNNNTDYIVEIHYVYPGGDEIIMPVLYANEIEGFEFRKKLWLHPNAMFKKKIPTKEFVRLFKKVHTLPLQGWNHQCQSYHLNEYCIILRKKDVVKAFIKISLEDECPEVNFYPRYEPFVLMGRNQQQLFYDLIEEEMPKYPDEKKDK